MNVLVLGGYGLIGEAIVRRLMKDGHQVTGLGRRVAAAERRLPGTRWVSADIAALARPADWRALLSGIEAVVNAAGALQDGARDDLEAIHHTAVAALVTACETNGVGRFVQISAAGVRPDAATSFFRTKARGDSAVAMSSLDWTILRPGLVIAPAAYGGTALLRALAACPLFMPAVFADRPVQTVGIEDVADAVARAVRGELPARLTADLVEERAAPLRAVLCEFRAWLGLPVVPVVAIPSVAAHVTGWFADGLGRLGWRSPLRSTAMASVAGGVSGDPETWRRATGGRCRPLAETLQDQPATVQERWFARLWLLKPLILATLSIFWIVSGAIGLAELGSASAVLTRRGFDAGFAESAVLIGSLFDLALGFAVLWRRAAALALAGMLLVSAGYLVAASLFAADLWLDPLGPLVKTIPAAMLALVALGVLEER